MVIHFLFLVSEAGGLYRDMGLDIRRVHDDKAFDTFSSKYCEIINFCDLVQLN